jgi:hypothetical protein
MKKQWQTWKYALGSFSDEQTKGQDDKIAAIRTVIVLLNVFCGLLIMINILKNW